MGVTTKLDSNTGTLHIEVSGRFDFGVHQQFRDATNLTDDKINVIEVNLAQTDYLDSSALGMLLVLRDRLGENRNAVRIKNAKPEVRKILEIANFDKLFTLV
ncbi:STAS domain-containing protein [Methylomarinum sp. Ch1-1]|uniref:STAS domain-containing protein n=1 Tax=Methylomarinum roseum TaxID=3067653 RepID=A0AAU7NPR8_9GAMM|nr:STAS domain-containing protein [Methylomarinum sp. Ch1-1]MDP4521134.1 STAS domain-containing protein [Methylomarinum sp. Ch1-1]